MRPHSFILFFCLFAVDHAQFRVDKDPKFPPAGPDATLGYESAQFQKDEEKGHIEFAIKWWFDNATPVPEKGKKYYFSLGNIVTLKPIERMILRSAATSAALTQQQYDTTYEPGIGSLNPTIKGALMGALMARTRSEPMTGGGPRVYQLFATVVEERSLIISYEWFQPGNKSPARINKVPTPGACRILGKYQPIGGIEDNPDPRVDFELSRARAASMSFPEEAAGEYWNHYDAGYDLDWSYIYELMDEMYLRGYEKGRAVNQKKIHRKKRRFTNYY